MSRHRAAPLVAALLVASLGARPTVVDGQRAPRLPVIAGAMGMNLIVNVDGTVMSWGSPGGEATYLGDGTENERKTPALIPGLTDIIDASVGPRHALVLKRDGTVLGWGRNDACELTVTDDRKRLAPIVMAGVLDAVQVAAGEDFSVAVLNDGTVRVWGSHDAGYFGNGPEPKHMDCEPKPTPVQGLTGVKKVVIGNQQMYALKADGTVWAWGHNKDGELCDGTTETRTRPAQVQGLADVVDVAASDAPVFVRADGTVWVCGGNINGHLGPGVAKSVKQTTPRKMPGITNAVAAMSAGGSMVRLKDGTMLGWGSGMFGSLGDGFIDKVTPTPHPPIGLGPVLASWYASNSAFALKADGTIMAWGYYVGGEHEWALKPFPFYKVSLTP
ncbi:MAG: hypothetical protein HY084_08190 [Gemmatimonadetes bacterium]|nr:hypothetical protein [Gemmatimonadota bacterium]